MSNTKNVENNKVKLDGLSITPSLEHPSVNTTLVNYSIETNNLTSDVELNNVLLDVGIFFGWFTCSYPYKREDMEKIQEIYYEETLDEFVPGNKGTFKGYTDGIKSVEGAVMCWSEGKTHGVLSIPQTSIESIGLERITKLMYRLTNEIKELKVTRLDCYISDYTNVLKVNDFRDALNNDNYISKAKIYDTGDSRKIRVNGKLEALTDFVSIGSRSSEVFYRIYNKELESKGKVKGVRVEVELKSDVANATCRGILSDVIEKRFDCKKGDILEVDMKKLEELIVGVVIGRIDFVDKNSATRKSNAKRLNWWKCFLGSLKAKKFKVIAPRNETNLDNKIKYVKKYMAPTLATILEFMDYQGVGKEYLTDLFSDGNARRHPRHNAVLKQAIKRVDENNCLKAIA